jgi:lysylphosphatidylglycerol synthetase-like protein (DUF2156 family)
MANEPVITSEEVKTVRVVVDKDLSVRYSLIALAVILIIFCTASAITSVSHRGIISILSLLADICGVILGILLLFGLFKNEKKSLNAAYLSSLIMFILMVIIVILLIIQIALSSSEQQSKLPGGSLVLSIIILIILAATPFAIAHHIKVTFGSKVSVTPLEFVTCAPCRGIRVEVKKANAAFPVNAV